VRIASAATEDHYIYDLKDNIPTKITVLGEGIPYHLKIACENRKPPLTIFLKYPGSKMDHSKIDLEIFGSLKSKEPSSYSY